MKPQELIKEIQKLPIQERMYVIERSMNLIQDNELRKAADVLYQDYIHDKDLTAFTTLDFENFYEIR